MPKSHLFGRLGEEDYNFKARLCNLVKPCLKIKNIKG